MSFCYPYMKLYQPIFKRKIVFSQSDGQVLLQVGYFTTSSRHRCPIENIKLKLKTKSQIETRLPELKYSDANSRSFNVQPSLHKT
jgi:hypothetical protein